MELSKEIKCGNIQLQKIKKELIYYVFNVNS